MLSDSPGLGLFLGASQRFPDALSITHLPSAFNRADRQAAFLLRNGYGHQAPMCPQQRPSGERDQSQHSPRPVALKGRARQ